MARKDTSSINEKGIPLMDNFYKQYFKAQQIIRPQESDYENNTKLARWDIDCGVDVQVITNTGETIKIQEKVRKHDKIEFGDFTLGIYLNYYAKELWDGEYIKFKNCDEHFRPKLYFTVYLNETEDAIEKWYLTDINKMLDYVDEHYIIEKRNVLRCIGKGLEQFLDPVEFTFDNIKEGQEFISKILNFYYKHCIEFHHNVVYTAKNIRYNEGIEDGCSGTSFFGIPWQEMIQNGLVFDYKKGE